MKDKHLTEINGVNEVKDTDEGVAVFTNRHEDTGSVPENKELEINGYTITGTKTLAYQRVVFLKQ